MYKVKVISLVRRKDRRKLFKKTFGELFPFEFVNAIDGKKYELTKEDSELIKGNEYHKYGIHIPSLVAANRTHLQLLTECSQDSVPYVIMEDDAKLIKDFNIDFDRLSNRKLDVYWLMEKEPSILAYMVWPSGAKKLLKLIYEEYKLPTGLDWSFLDIRNRNILNQDEIDEAFVYQIPGQDLDITESEFYRVVD